MARKKKESLVDDLFSIASALPWWISVVIAIVAYLVCHSYATADIPAAKDLHQLGPQFQLGLIKVFASFGQVVLPLIFLGGAIASAIAQAKRGTGSSKNAQTFEDYVSRQPLPRTEPAGDGFPDQPDEDVDPTWKEAPQNGTSAPLDQTRWSAELLSALEWRRFEMVCTGLFERLGFSTSSATKGADGGVDIHLFRPPMQEAVAIVQCKAWTESSKVGVRYIRELRGVMASLGISEGIFATTTRFSDDAIEFAKENHIDLMDGRRVLDAILTLPEDHQASLLELATTGDFTTPTCASCGVKMVERRAKGGGRPFWGCVNYPKCRTRLQIAKAGA